MSTPAEPEGPAEPRAATLGSRFPAAPTMLAPPSIHESSTGAFQDVRASAAPTLRGRGSFRRARLNSSNRQAGPRARRGSSTCGRPRQSLARSRSPIIADHERIFSGSSTLQARSVALTTVARAVPYLEPVRGGLNFHATCPSSRMLLHRLRGGLPLLRAPPGSTHFPTRPCCDDPGPLDARRR